MEEEEEASIEAVEDLVEEEADSIVEEAEVEAEAVSTDSKTTVLQSM